MDTWFNFLLAEVGASATLTGLIFVGVSINLSKILAEPQLPNRAFEALFLLLDVLLVCSLLLVPGQSLALAGIELLVLQLLVWYVVVRLDISSWRKTEPQYRGNYQQMILVNQVDMLLYVLAAGFLLFNGIAGLYWLVPAVLLSFVKALIDAWVLLVEINR